jgi:general secretion pathway protein I
MSTRGFTLVEVLVALVIVAIGMTAVLSAITSAADTTAYLRDKTFAEWVAMNRVAELRLQPRRAASGKDSGEVEFAGRRWRWEQEITKIAEVPGVQRIEVRVRPDEAGARKDAAWVATVSGMTGDAVAPPDGQVLDWSGQSLSPGSGQGPLPPGRPTPSNGSQQELEEEVEPPATPPGIETR